MSATLCPRGTQRNQTTGAAESDCWPCDPGYYCDSEGMLGPTGVCDARYYCPDSAKIDSAMPTSYECPPGYYCPAGTGTPVACPPGMFYCILLLVPNRSHFFNFIMNIHIYQYHQTCFI